MLVGKFHIEGNDGYDLQFKLNENWKNSVPELKGIFMSEKGGKSPLSIGGKIVSNKILPGVYSLFDSGFNFYDIKYITRNDNDDKGYKIKLISERIETSQTKAYDHAINIKKTIDGSARIYITDDNLYNNNK